MIYIQAAKRAFITDSMGNIHVFDLIEYIPRRVAEISTESKNSLKCLKYDPESRPFLNTVSNMDFGLMLMKGKHNLVNFEADNEFEADFKFVDSLI